MTAFLFMPWWAGWLLLGWVAGTFATFALWALLTRGSRG